jgi:hypothetical protein
MKKTLFIILSVLSYKLNAQVQANTNTGNLKVIGALKIEQPVCYSGDIIEGVYSIQNIRLSLLNYFGLRCCFIELGRFVYFLQGFYTFFKQNFSLAHLLYN